LVVTILSWSVCQRQSSAITSPRMFFLARPKFRLHVLAFSASLSRRAVRSLPQKRTRARCHGA
jgi:hypothetical protein